MADVTNSEKKTVILKTDQKELRFSVGITEFNGFQNEMLPNNKVSPAYNFLMKCVHPDDKEDVIELCDQGLTIDLGNLVAGEFKPNVGLCVKK